MSLQKRAFLVKDITDDCMRQSCIIRYILEQVFANLRGQKKSPVDKILLMILFHGTFGEPWGCGKCGRILGIWCQWIHHSAGMGGAPCWKSLEFFSWNCLMDPGLCSLPTMLSSLLLTGLSVPRLHRGGRAWVRHDEYERQRCLWP